jgi:hypothetical protein
VGLRALTLARFLGWTSIDVFGMDGCESDEHGKHAAEHPNQPKARKPLEYAGRTFWTTESMAFCAKQTFHELDEMPDVTCRFHGDGLVQAMAEDYVRGGHKHATIGYVKPTLITPEYAALNRQLHESNMAYGVGGGKHADTVRRLVKGLTGTLGRTPAVLDYGCGKGLLAKALEFPIWEYDPAIPEKSEAPRPADLVVCTDVLEHIEPDRLLYVLGDLQRVTKQVGYFVIHTGPAAKTLPDGRNTHLIQKGEAWWRKQLTRVFVVGSILKKGMELHCIVGPSQGDKRHLMASAVNIQAEA